MEPLPTPDAWRDFATYLSEQGIGAISPGQGIALVRILHAIDRVLATEAAGPHHHLLERYVEALRFVTLCAAHHQAHVIDEVERLVNRQQGAP